MKSIRALFTAFTETPSSLVMLSLFAYPLAFGCQNTNSFFHVTCIIGVSIAVVMTWKEFTRLKKSQNP